MEEGRKLAQQIVAAQGELAFWREKLHQAQRQTENLDKANMLELEIRTMLNDAERDLTKLENEFDKMYGIQ